MISRLSTVRHTIDLGLFLPTAGLLLIGLLVTGSLSLSDPIAFYAEDSTLAWGHVLRAAFALLLMVGVMSVPPERIQRAGLVLYLLALAVLITAYFDAFHRFGFGVIHRPWIWFDLPLIGERGIEWLSWVQLAIPLALASWMARTGEDRWPVAVVTAVALLVPVFLDGLQFPYRFGWVLISVLLMLAVPCPSAGANLKATAGARPSSSSATGWKNWPDTLNPDRSASTGTPPLRLRYLTLDRGFHHARAASAIRHRPGR